MDCNVKFIICFVSFFNILTYVKSKPTAEKCSSWCQSQEFQSGCEIHETNGACSMDSNGDIRYTTASSHLEVVPYFKNNSNIGLPYLNVTWWTNLEDYIKVTEYKLELQYCKNWECFSGSKNFSSISCLTFSRNKIGQVVKQYYSCLPVGSYAVKLYTKVTEKLWDVQEVMVYTKEKFNDAKNVNMWSPEFVQLQSVCMKNFSVRFTPAADEFNIQTYDLALQNNEDQTDIVKKTLTYKTGDRVMDWTFNIQNELIQQGLYRILIVQVHVDAWAYTAYQFSLEDSAPYCSANYNVITDISDESMVSNIGASQSDEHSTVKYLAPILMTVAVGVVVTMVAFLIVLVWRKYRRSKQEQHERKREHEAASQAFIRINEMSSLQPTQALLPQQLDPEQYTEIKENSAPNKYSQESGFVDSPFNDEETKSCDEV